jgi:hypothetical protein
LKSIGELASSHHNPSLIKKVAGLNKTKGGAQDKLRFQNASANRNMNLICFPVYAITFCACIGNIDIMSAKKNEFQAYFLINLRIQNQAQDIINNVKHLHITGR